MRGALLGALLAAAILSGCDRASEEQIAQLNASLQQSRAECASLAAEKEQAQARLSELEQQVTALKTERDEARAELTAARKELDELQSALVELEKAEPEPAPPAAAEPSLDVEPVRARLEALGADLFERGDYGAANAVLLSAYDLGSRSPLTFHRLAYAQATAGKYGDAIGWYERALSELEKQDEPDPVLYAKCLNNYGVALARSGKPSEAIAAYKRAIEILPQYAAPYYNLALVYARQEEERDKAIEALRRHVANGGSRSASARDILRKLMAEQPAVDTPPGAP